MSHSVPSSAGRAAVKEGVPTPIPGANRVFGEVPVNIQHSDIKSGEISVDALVKVAESIFERVKLANVPRKDHAGTDQLLRKLWDEYRDFSKELPIVMRWTVQAREFSSKAFRAYLTKVHKPHWPERKDFLYGQVEYLVMLYRERNRRCSPQQLTRYREQVRKRVMEDDKRFMAANEEAEKLIEDNKARRTETLRQLVLSEAKGTKFPIVSVAGVLVEGRPGGLWCRECGRPLWTDAAAAKIVAATQFAAGQELATLALAPLSDDPAFCHHHAVRAA